MWTGILSFFDDFLAASPQLQQFKWLDEDGARTFGSLLQDR